MAAASSKHLVEGELAMQVLLDDVQPLGFSLLPLQLLQWRTVVVGELTILIIISNSCVITYCYTGKKKAFLFRVSVFLLSFEPEFAKCHTS